MVLPSSKGVSNSFLNLKHTTLKLDVVFCIYVHELHLTLRDLTLLIVQENINSNVLLHYTKI
jgi:hypothetical protein